MCAKTNQNDWICYNSVNKSSWIRTGARFNVKCSRITARRSGEVLQEDTDTHLHPPESPSDFDRTAFMDSRLLSGFVLVFRYLFCSTKCMTKLTIVYLLGF